MAQSNEFTGRTLNAAIRAATAAYDCDQKFNARTQRRCNDLIAELSKMSLQAARFADEAARLEREAEALRGQAAREGVVALLSFFGGAAAFFAKGKRAARALERMREGDLSRSTILEFLSAFGLVGGALSGYFAVEKYREAEKLNRQAQYLSARGQRFGEKYLSALDEYERLGCGVNRTSPGT